MRKNHKYIAAALSIMVAVSLGVWADKMLLQPYSAPGSGKVGSGSISGRTLADVEINNGEKGKSCWVVVNNLIYEISDFKKWAGTLRISLDSRLQCGKDLSDVVGNSQDDKAALNDLKVVGPLHQQGVNRLE